MAQLQRVAITGMGAICGLGHNLKDIWPNLLEGKSGISSITTINLDDYPVRIAGEVKNFHLDESILPAKEADRYDRFIHFALHSAKEAWTQANLESKYYGNERMGCILGVGLGGFPYIEKEHGVLATKGPRRVSPFFIPSVIPNMATGMISIRFGLEGVNYSLASACASATHAIGAAAMEIMLGRQDLVITGGAESVLNKLTFAAFSNMKALSRRNDQPTQASRPFDCDRDGFVIGDGAGVLVLENFAKAQERGAKIYAELVGFGSSSDAYHITAPHEEGKGALACMKSTMANSGVRPEQVGHINAHGTSTPLGDVAEIKAIKKAFGLHAPKLHICSTKSMIGHLLGAAGGIECIFSALALFHGIIPPTINVVHQDPECDLNVTPNRMVKAPIEYALSNSFGFGGTNSSVLLKKIV